MTIDKQREAIREALAEEFMCEHRCLEHPHDASNAVHIALAFLHENGRNTAAERLVDVYGLDPFQAMEYAGVMCDAIFGTAPLIEPEKPH